MTHASMDAAAQKAAGLGPTLIRLSVGIEDPRNLIADLAQAFAAVQAAIRIAPPQVTTPTTAGSVATQIASEQQFRINPALAAFW